MKDELFLRGAQVPMTKEAVRALALAKLELHRARHLIDIGAGTGCGEVIVYAWMDRRRENSEKPYGTRLRAGLAVSARLVGK